MELRKLSEGPGGGGGHHSLCEEVISELSLEEAR